MTRIPMPAAALAATLAAVLAAGCAADSGTPGADGAGRMDAEPVVPVALQPAPQDSMLTQSCTNFDAGFRVSYPADWQTNDDTIMPTCSLFDPQPIVIEPATEIPADIGVVITLEQVTFDVAIGDDFTRRVMSREPVIVAGRNAVRLEAESNGQGLHDAGTISYGYVIDLDGAVIIAQSYDVGEPDYATKKRVLDSMMRSIRVD